MSKNLTRKGLALGALVALSSTLFAGAPASAAGVNDGSVTIAPSSGTSYNALLTTVFDLNVNYVSGIAINGAKLSALVEDSTAKVKASFDQPVDSTTLDKTFTAGSVVVESAKTADSAGAATADVLRLELPSTVTTTTSVNITAWYDSDADKVIDANEKVTPTVTVKFHAAADVAWTTTVLTPVIGTDDIDATITSVPELNGQLIGNSADVTADFGTTITGDATVINSTVTSVYDVDNKIWNVASRHADIDNVAGGETFSAQAKIMGATVGTRTYAAAAAATAFKTTATVVSSTDVDETGLIRATQRSATVKLAVTDEDGAAVKAGIPVVVTMTVSTGTLDGDVTVNGTVVASAGTKTVYTDSTGTAVVTVKAPVDVADGDIITLSWATVQGVSGTESGASPSSAAPTLEWDIAHYGAYETTKHYSTKDILTTSGQSTTIPVKVVDQWGVAIPAGYYVGAAATVRTVATTYTEIVNGAANVVIADGKVTTGTTTVDFEIYKLVSGSYVAADGSGTLLDANDAVGLDSGNYTITYADAATYSNTIDTGVDVTGLVSEDAATAADTEIDNLAAPLSGASVAITGSIKNSTTGSPAAGALVTVKGDGLLFSVGNKFALGELTFYASSTGTYSIDLYANKATTGTVVTVSSLGASDTETVVFTSELDAKTFTLSAPAYAAAGTAVDVVATVADKWGNGVAATDIVLSSSGAGYLNSTGSTTTITSGIVRAKLIFGAAESGSAVITATTGTVALASADKKKTATVTIGKAPAAPGSATAAVAGSTGKFYVSVTNAAAKKVVIKVAGKFVSSFTGTAAKKTVVTKATKGSKKVTVYVGGKLVATKTVTVK